MAKRSRVIFTFSRMHLVHTFASRWRVLSWNSPTDFTDLHILHNNFLLEPEHLGHLGKLQQWKSNFVYLFWELSSNDGRTNE